MTFCKLFPRRCSSSLKASLALLATSLVLCLYTLSSLPSNSLPRRGVALVLGPGFPSSYLSHVIRVLGVVGFEVRHANPLPSDDGSASTEWDFMWSHSYPFNSMPELKKIRNHQRVNKIPGMGFITNKVDLAKLSSLHIPVAFRVPDELADFRRYAASKPRTLWVSKSNQHRGVRLEAVHELLRQGRGPPDAEKTFLQEFVARPLLIDNRKFDVGVYVVVTSVDPLIVYSFHADALFRFCTRDYRPFDAADQAKYVVGDDYTPMWEIPSLRRFLIEEGMNFKGAFDAHLASRGLNSSAVWRGVDEAIAEVFIKNQANLEAALQGFSFPFNFFEMVRFDFIVDEDLRVFLMEVNMSPNLSSQHFRANRRLYEQVLYNLFALTRINFAQFSLTSLGSSEDRDMAAADGDLSVLDAEEIAACDAACDSPPGGVCSLTKRCATRGEREKLREFYLEHKAKREMRRILPTRRRFGGSKADRMIVAWIERKCKVDEDWCRG